MEACWLSLIKQGYDLLHVQIVVQMNITYKISISLCLKYVF